MATKSKVNKTGELLDTKYLIPDNWPVTRVWDDTTVLDLTHKTEHSFLHYVLVKIQQFVAVADNNDTTIDVRNEYQLLVIIENQYGLPQVVSITGECESIDIVMGFVTDQKLHINFMVSATYIDSDQKSTNTVKSYEGQFMVFGNTPLSAKYVGALRDHLGFNAPYWCTL